MKPYNKDSLLKIGYRKDYNDTKLVLNEEGTSLVKIYEEGDEEYIKEGNKKVEESISYFYNLITSVEDLIKFPFDHCMVCSDSEYMNWAAREAYRRRAREFFGVEIPEFSKQLDGYIISPLVGCKKE